MTHRTNHLSWRRLGAAVLALGLIAGACGGEETTGSSLTTIKGGGAGGARGIIEGTTTTTKAPKKPKDDKGNQSASQTTAPPETAPPTTEAPKIINVIEIRDDTHPDGAMSDYFYQVPKGQVVRWKNTGSKPYSIEFTDGSFTSGKIKPGDHVDWPADVDGTYDYRDGTRPYVQARVQVFS